MLAACTRSFYSISANRTSRAVNTGLKSVNKKNTRLSKSWHSRYGAENCLSKVALRKYTAPPEVEAVTKKWNLELNKLLKLRYFEEAVSHYEKMKESGATPNASTFLIMFDTYMNWQDNNAIRALLEDIKARGINTQFAKIDAQLEELSQQGRIGRDKATEVKLKLIRSRRAGLNPFEVAK